MFAKTTVANLQRRDNKQFCLSCKPIRKHVKKPFASQRKK